MRSPRLTGAVCAGTRCAVAVIVGVMALVGRAEAHQTSVKYVDVTVEGRGAQVRVTVAPGDVTEALGLAAEARPTVAEASTAEVARYVAGWLAVGGIAGLILGALLALAGSMIVIVKSVKKLFV